MKKLGIFMIMISFIACQSEKKENNTGDSTEVISHSDSLTFKYDSLKVYNKNTVSVDKKVDTSKAIIVYPIFSDEKINQFVLQKVMKMADEGKNYKSYHDYATDFIKGFDDFQTENDDRVQTWFLDIKTEVAVQRQNYLSLLTTFVNYSGGAHPNSIYTYLNYNPVSHQEILLDSLIKPGTLPQLTTIAEKIFRKNEKLSATASLKDNYFFKDNKFSLNRNFTIVKEGLKFLYNPYEIKAYVFGTTELVIPFSELKAIARPNSLLNPIN